MNKSMDGIQNPEVRSQKIDLKPFCSTSRDVLKDPWSRDDFSAATDGMILIRVDRRADIPFREEAPTIEEIFRRNVPKLIPKWANLPTFPALEFTACDDCGGDEISRKTCEDCDGLGQVEK